MAKIDDLAELMVEELSDFKLQLNKMEQLSKELQTISLAPDMTEMKSVLNINLKQQEDLSQTQNRKLSELTKRLSKSNHYPNWLLMLFGAILLFCFSMISFSIYQIQLSSVNNKASYEKGQQEIIIHFNEFLKNTPRANEDYQNWNTNKTK